MQSDLFDVAVVGCGPVGGLAANLLARAGLRTLVLEPHREPYVLPRAVHIDHEAMRLFQAAGLAERLAPSMRATDGHLHLGADGDVIRFLGTAGLARAYGWSNDSFFYQPELEAVLREGLLARPEVTAHFGAGVTGIEQDADAVTLATDGGEHFRARWVIGCDGASSPLRRLLGVRLDDLQFDEPWLVIDAEVDGPVTFPPLPSAPPNTDLQRLSVMICDPARPATVVPGRGRHRRWEFMLLPGETEAEMRQPKRALGLLAPWVRDTPHEVIRIATYRFHGLVAEHWRSNRVFLAGDAAHQTPPFFGQGMCHGLRDVANLAWKLRLVCDGAAGPEILDSYQQEREPQVRAVIARAVEVGRGICELDPARAHARDARLREEGAHRPGRSAPEIVPPLHAGVVGTGGGVRFVQPLVRDPGGERVLLDDRTGAGWRLILRDRGAAAGLGARARAVRDALAMTAWALEPTEAAEELDDVDGALLAWLDGAGVDAVIVRPDFYVYGAVRAGELASLFDDLASRLGLVALEAAFDRAVPIGAVT